MIIAIQEHTFRFIMVGEVNINLIQGILQPLQGIMISCDRKWNASL